MISIKTFKIYLKINDFEINTFGTLDETILLFEYDNVKYTFDLEKVTLKRENEEFLSIMNFLIDEKNFCYILKEQNSKFYYNLIIKEFTKEDNKVIINYLMNEEEFKLKLTWEENYEY